MQQRPFPWNRRPSYAPRPPYPQAPPPPPPPPVEISTTTKNKLQRFQFKPPRSREANARTDDRPEGVGRRSSNSSKPDRSEGPPVGPGNAAMAASSAAALLAGPRTASAGRPSQTGGQRAGQQQPVDGPAKGAAAAALATAATAATTTRAAENDADKENTESTAGLPSTQPNKIAAAIAVTPEFLSIHVGTPRARFAWQDLVGTPDTPKVRESLGISPNAKLSWMTEQQAPVLSPVAAKQGGTKRTRSSSPPSSPTNSRSKRVAENVQKFKEAMAAAASTDGALESKFSHRRTALARHRTEVSRPTTRTNEADARAAAAAAAAADPPAPDGRSPRGVPAFRRSASCNTLPSKRQRIDGAAESGLRRAHDESAGALEPATGRPLSPPRLQRLSLQAGDARPPGSASIPDTESVRRDGAEPEPQPQRQPPQTKASDSLSDYGDDVFDDDMLAELDASLAPAAAERTPALAAADADEDNQTQDAPGPDDGAMRDEFDDLDDDLFTAAEDLMAEVDCDAAAAAGPKPASRADPGGGLVGDVEDLYGDDFGEDFDFDAAEQAATQAAGSRAAAVPWTNSQNSGQRRRAIQRYLVTDVLTSSYRDERQRPAQEKILVVQKDGDKAGSALRAVHLRGDWFDTPASATAFVHVLGEFDTSGVCVVDNDRNMLILHPDQLVSSTVVADSFDCTRRAVLQDRVKATSDASAPLVYGTLLHEIFQDALMANQWGSAFLNGVIDKAIKKHLEALYTIRASPSAAREHLLAKTREMQAWAAVFVAATPQPNALVQGRHGERVGMCVSKLLDVEEHVWSPMYGLKGNIDATVQVTMGGRGEATRVLTVPFELKTGRNARSNHQAQTALYNLLLSDRYDIEIAYGILYYMETSQTLRIPAVRHELRHMIMKRNALACYIRERSVQLPPMLQNRNTCGRCYAQASCFIYHKLADDGTGETSGMGSAFDDVVGHLTPRHKAFFLKWEDLLTKEERESQKMRRELWTMVSAEREALGRCFADVVIQAGDGGGGHEAAAAAAAAEAAAEAEAEAGRAKINRFRYTFAKANPAPGFSFLDSQITVGEPVVVSDEAGHFALALGFATAVRQHSIDVAVDRRLHNARTRQAGFHEATNQVFSSIMAVGGGGGGGSNNSNNSSSAAPAAAATRYRLDKDEFSNGMATVRNNLVQVMAGSRTGQRELRQLVVDLVAPRFKAVSTQYALSDSRTEPLNEDQKRAIAKVMSAEDYALVLGMPGTGKTTTIAHIIRALVGQKKSVLLTSYTHTAVDNILLKLRAAAIPVLRLGAAAKVHPEVQAFAQLGGEARTSFEAIEQAWHGTPVVATTCLGINHPLFGERTFDYCIVDEASQITLPICLGPIRMARTFVLVGDHNQLPPLVQNEAARAGGLDVSLFKLLSDTHPASVVNLEHQYRMCEDIMALSNTLIYRGRLKCGTDALRRRCLAVPQLARLQRHHHHGADDGRAASCTMAPCWLHDLLRPETRVAFVNTDAIEGSREVARGNRTVNPCEARLVAQLVEGLLTAGVAAADIGVMTHYRSQLSLLKTQLRGITGQLGVGGGGQTIEMHTADRFQGRDKEVVVLSLVRSNEACNIGDLLKDWRRINVAFTRAKTKLLVVGSRSTLLGSLGSAKEGKETATAADYDPDTMGDEMLARFVRLMDERAWIYDLPSDALESHRFDEFPPTQPARAPLGPVQSARNGLPPSPAPPLLGGLGLGVGKENRQPTRRAQISKETLLKGKPILQGILHDMMGGKY